MMEFGGEGCFSFVLFDNDDGVRSVGLNALLLLF